MQFTVEYQLKVARHNMLGHAFRCAIKKNKMRKTAHIRNTGLFYEGFTDKIRVFIGVNSLNSLTTLNKENKTKN